MKKKVVTGLQEGKKGCVIKWKRANPPKCCTDFYLAEKGAVCDAVVVKKKKWLEYLQRLK